MMRGPYTLVHNQFIAESNARIRALEAALAAALVVIDAVIAWSSAETAWANACTNQTMDDKSDVYERRIRAAIALSGAIDAYRAPGAADGGAHRCAHPDCDGGGPTPRGEGDE